MRIIFIMALTVMFGVSSSAADVSPPDTLALAFPIAAPGTECNRIIVNSAQPIVATYLGNSATYSNDLYLELDAEGNPGCDGIRTNDLFIFNNKQSPVGSSVTFGPYPVGTELIFRLYVRNTGANWYTGPPGQALCSGNDSRCGGCRARVQGGWQENTTLVSWEDLVDCYFNDLSFSFTNTSPVVVFCPDLTAVTVNQPYHAALSAIGGIEPYTYSIAGQLPPGLTLANPATGEITGTPTTAGDFTFTASVTDARAGVDTETCTISVSIARVAAIQESCTHSMTGAEYLATVHFALVNFASSTPICRVQLLPEGSNDECNIDACGATSGWTCVPGGGQAEMQAGTAIDCLVAGQMRRGFYFVLRSQQANSTGFCCYIVRFLDETGAVVAEQEECFDCMAVGVRLENWTQVKSLYR